MQWGASPLLICRDRSSGRLRIALAKDDTAIIFGEDVAFGGVFRCTMVSLCLTQSNALPKPVAGFSGRIWWATKLKQN
jgi:hypothetical protein